MHNGFVDPETRTDVLGSHIANLIAAQVQFGDGGA
jgi:hypothetical protein